MQIALASIMQLPFRQKIVAVILAAVVLISILELVRRRKLLEEYSWLWLVTGALLILLIVWYDVLLNLMNLIGSTNPTLTLFFAALLFLLLLNLHFTTKISELTAKVKNLTQELALARLEIKKHEAEGNSSHITKDKN